MQPLVIGRPARSVLSCVHTVRGTSVDGRLRSLRRKTDSNSKDGQAKTACSGLPSFGSASYGPRTTTKSWEIPTQLLSCKSTYQVISTVYTVRLTTSFDRGSALSEPLAGVNVCLIGKDGNAVLHRVPPVNDPAENMKAMEQICSLVGEDAGADCSSLDSVDQPQVWPAGKAPVTKPRFQEGSVDEISFVAPELGGLAAVLVAPETGSWVCDEVDVFSSRTKHMDRFVCRKRLGGRKGDPAAYLTPVPPDAVVYGTGDAARIITKEQAAALHALSLSEYGSLKARLLLTTALLTMGGSGLAAIASGLDAAVPFALGGVAGLLYQLLLQVGADAAVSSAAAAASASSVSSVNAAVDAYKAATARSSGTAAAETVVPVVADTSGEGLGGRMVKVLGSSAVRLALVTSAALVAVWAVQDTSGTKEGTDAVLFTLSPVSAWQMGLGLCGFMMYKVAVLGVSLVPASQNRVPEPAQQLEKNA